MSVFTGTWTLVRHALRRERIMLPVWIVVLAGMAAAMPAAFTNLYTTSEDVAGLAASMNTSPSMLLMLGKVYEPTIGGLVSWRYAALGSAVAAIMAIFTVIRHTRREEENGRLELIGSTVVGRYAALTAAIIVGWGASILVGLLGGALVAGQSSAVFDGSVDAPGAIALGLGMTCAGMVFSSIAALAAQVVTSARAAVGLSAAVLGVSYLLRGVADSEESLSWLSWISPIGWCEQIRPFAGNRWWVIGLAVAAAVVLAVACLPILTRRDLGAGLLPDRPGPATSAIASPFALAWRIQRGVFLGWLAGLSVYGLAIGALADSMSDFTDGSPQIAEILEGMGGTTGIVNASIVAMVAFLAIMASMYVVQTILRLEIEEASGRAETVLATSVSRAGWLGSFATVAFGGVSAIMVVQGLIIGVVHGSISGDIGQGLTDSLGSVLATLPAIAIFGGVAIALYGLLPRFVGWSWAVLGVAVVVGQFGDLLSLPDWLRGISPFDHVSQIPGGDFQPVPAAVMVAVALVLVGLGFASFRRRDVLAGA